jgi:hypothetical protein
MPNAKVSDGRQPPMTSDLSLSESAGARSLGRLVRQSIEFIPINLQMPTEPSESDITV